MKSAGQVAVLTVLVVVVLASVSADEINHLPFRHIPRHQTLLNLPVGKDARDNYRLSKMVTQLFNKRGVNDLY